MNGDLISRSALKAHMDECSQDIRDRAYYGYAVSFIDNAPAVDAGPKWISVEERLPVEEAIDYIRQHDDLPEYLVCIRGAEVPTTLLFTGDGWTDGDSNYYPVTHWMPLPEPPKEG